MVYRIIFLESLRDIPRSLKDIFHAYPLHPATALWRTVHEQRGRN